MQSADAITILDNRNGTLTAGGGGLSESYENYESYESVGGAAELCHGGFFAKALQSLGLSHRRKP